MRNIYILVIALLLTVNSWAQAPQKMSYQAVIRNTSNALITSSPVGMQISILQGSSSGSVVYAETQTTSTNANGLVSIEIGTGTVVTGTFTAINWANGPYFIKTETDPTGGTAYTISGTSELLSVPYALHAKTAESITGGITETDPVFVASPANGILSSDINNWNNKLSNEVDGSITNELQTLSISNDTVYLSNGGYAKLPAGFDGNYNNLTNKPTNVSTFTNDAGYLTSFTEVDGSIMNELQTLSIGHDTIYLSNGGYTKLPAGFDGNYNSLTNKPTAVSSFSNDAGYLTSFTEIDGSTTNELQTLSIGHDTIYLSNGGYTKLPAGFDGNYNSLTNKPTAVSSFSNDAGYLTSFTEVDGSITNELQALRISNDTIYLSNGGFAKLPATNAWGLNGNAATSTNFIGTTNGNPLNFKVSNQKAGKIDINTASVFFGAWAGNSSTGNDNNAFGQSAFYSNTTGTGNSVFGDEALANSITGNRNTAIGQYAMGLKAGGDNNTAIGYSALQSSSSGSNNTGIGAEAGTGNTGSSNIFIGNQAGLNSSGSNKLYIANSSGAPLIYGDFASKKVGLNTNTPNATLDLGVTTPSSNPFLLLYNNDPSGPYNGTKSGFYGDQFSLQNNMTYVFPTLAAYPGSFMIASKSTNTTTLVPRLTVLGETGNIGVGTTTPSAKLEVQGSVKIVDGTQATGKVLTSDANGLASWEAKESKAYGMIYRINAFDIPVITTWTDLPLDGGENNLINVAHSTTTNPERITVGVSGTYIIQYVIHYRRQNFPHHGVSRLMKNGTNEILGSYTIASPISGDGNEEDPLSTQVITTLSANDYINLQVATNYNVTNEVDSYVGPDLPAPTTKVSVSITIVKIGD